MDKFAQEAIIEFQLDYHPSAQFAGLFLAQDLGLYKARGLSVTFLPPTREGGEEPELVVMRQAAMDSENSFPNNFESSRYEYSIGCEDAYCC